MQNYQIDIKIKRGLGFSISRTLLRRVIAIILRCEGIGEGGEVGCVITDDVIMHKLNKFYRGVDRTTDVLSFAFSEMANEVDSPVFPSVPGEGQNLGEIIISYPQATKQAPDHRNSIEEELLLLIVHGILHLLGYDHENTGDARIMRKREQDIINRIRKLKI
jgi:probable rRNA maturation factor